MRVAIISTTKNEEDIIESFVRHNGRLCDALFFLDASTDSTRSILALLKEEGFPVEMIEESNSEYYQGSVVTAAVQHLAAAQAFDWFFLLDADEFLAVENRAQLESILGAVPKSHLGALQWQTFVPVETQREGQDPILNCYKPRAYEGQPFHKLCIPASLAESVVLGPGNHSAMDVTGRSLLPVLLPVPLAHLPVRNQFQIMRKNIIATHNLIMKAKRLPGEGEHVFAILEQIRRGKYSLSLDSLQEMACSYAIFDQSASRELNHAWVPWTNERFPNRYTPNQDMVTLVAAFDQEVERLAKIILGYASSGQKP